MKSVNDNITSSILNHLSANPTEWSNMRKQFVGTFSFANGVYYF